MLLWLLRVCYVVLVVGTSAFTFVTIWNHETGEGLFQAVLGTSLVLGLGGLILYTDVREREKDITVISALFFGLLLGMLIGWLISFTAEPIVRAVFGGFAEETQTRLAHLARLLITLISTYATIALLLQTKDEFRFLIPYVEFSKQVKGGRALVLDTSVIIDGRIADVCDTRLIDTKLIVPKFVLNELQAIADSNDKMKRNRGRRGLDILKRLQNNTKIELVVQDSVGEVKAGEKVKVDERLVLFTKAIGGRVVTNDFNLNKIAQLQGVDVINLNEVANSLKTVALPGEYLQLKVVKGGDQPGQGVGYLDDGTMVVIEQGRGQIGNEVSITVTSVLQTPAGRMIFGRIESRPSGSFAPVGGPSSGSFTPVQQTGSGNTGHHRPVSTDTPGPIPPVKPNTDLPKS
ncbi:PIN/TRAM domain-containing protein [Limnoglobus roseus]|uniref:PIN/TRAM domain-containing protein n=1 Tax=Limnoglobus roseus TaxID=2598579 RepID=A0A5C1ANW3_9BACT|nr:PIN domain-containing protein [Limnoglobus roseus]QEL19706.1 PIN/TRAM domain-containing protein [Limnoglobus roseus]